MTVMQHVKKHTNVYSSLMQLD